METSAAKTKTVDAKWRDAIATRVKLETRRIEKQVRAVVREEILKVINGGAQAISPASIIGHIGLTHQQSATVDRARKRLLSEGKKKGPKLEKELDRLRVKLLRERAELIAEHETRLAHSIGQQAAWERLLSEGKLRGGARAWHKLWVASDDERTCGVCMELDGEEVGLNEPFGEYFAPPEPHVRCRCSVVLVEAGGRRSGEGPEDALHGHHDQKSHGRRKRGAPAGGEDGAKDWKAVGKLAERVNASGVKIDPAGMPEDAASAHAMLSAADASLSRMKAAGIAPPPNTVVGFAKMDRDIMAVCNGPEEGVLSGFRIEFNTAAREWGNEKAMRSTMKRDSSLKFSAVPTAEAIFTHEMGHALHRQHLSDTWKGGLHSAPDGASQFKRAWSYTRSNESRSLGRGVSRYARTSNVEFAAEYFTARMHGRTMSPAASAHYDSIFGPPIGSMGRHGAARQVEMFSAPAEPELPRRPR